MNDSVFGNLVYDGGWSKRETLNIWGRAVEVKIVVSAYPDEEPNSEQREAYEYLRSDLELISKATLKKLKQYMQAIEKDILAYGQLEALPSDVFELVSIREIMFLESGSFCIICQAKWDNHGVAVLCQEDSIKVGPEDILWLEE